MRVQGKRYTQAQATLDLQAVGMVLQYDDGEYRVNFKGGTEATAYYTTDLWDAVATGRKMRDAAPRT